MFIDRSIFAVTGRVTTKSDVFSFGVMLMELLTGRKALDETRPEESMHLVTWFGRLIRNKEAILNALDPVIEVNEETTRSILTVAELSGHCTVREPHKRPDMSHAVNVLSPLVEHWKPNDVPDEDIGIDLGEPLSEARYRGFVIFGQSFSIFGWEHEGLDREHTPVPVGARPYFCIDRWTVDSKCPGL